MGFMIVAILAIALTSLLIFRRATEERAIRWKLYALRDELRKLAYEDRSLLDSTLFRRLDRSITGQCATLTNVSIWSLLPLFAFNREGRRVVDARQRLLEAELDEQKAVARLYDQSVHLMMRHLLWRHMFLTTLAAVTLVGVWPVYVSAKWASERILSGALKPIGPVPG